MPLFLLQLQALAQLPSPFGLSLVVNDFTGSEGLDFAVVSIIIRRLSSGFGGKKVGLISH